MIEILIGSGATVFGVLVTYLTFVKNRDELIATEASEKAILAERLSYISLRVDDIYLKQEESNKTLSEMRKDIAEIGESVKSAHQRISRMEELGDKK